MSVNGLVVSGSLLAASGCAGLLLKDKILQLVNPDVTETFLADNFDFDYVDDDQQTLVSKSGLLTRTYIIEGKNYSYLSEEELKRNVALRQGCWDKLANEAVQLKLIHQKVPLDTIFSEEFDHQYLQALHNKWQSQFSRTFKLRTYLVVTQVPVGSIKFWQKPEVQKGRFDEVCDTLEELFAEVKIRPLKNDTSFSELLSFWGSLINGFPVVLRAKKYHIADHLCFSCTSFDSKEGIIEFEHCNQKLLACVLSHTSWGEESHHLVVRDLLSLPFQLSMVTLLKGFSKLRAKLELKDRKSQLQGIFPTLKAEDEFGAANELIDADEETLWQFQQSIVVFAATKEQLQEAISKVKQVFLGHGYSVALEKSIIEPMWRNQFPEHHNFIRPSLVLSHNLSHYFTFESEPQGTARSAWGEGPLRLFKTTTGEAYSFNFHIDESKDGLGHNLIVAPSASGKSTLMMHLIAGAMRHKDFRAYIFDRYKGCEVFCQGLGGDYIDINSGKVGLNPFVLDDTPANRNLLTGLLMRMAGFQEATNSIHKIVDYTFMAPKEHRIFSENAAAYLSNFDPSLSKLRQWAHGTYASWFNGQKNGVAYDALDLSASRLVGFEMTDILANPDICSAVVFYIFERIIMQLRSHKVPTHIFVDEASSMVEDPTFAIYGRQMLEMVRKLNGVISFCFQNPSSINRLSPDLKQAILNQCKTRVFFPNFEAKREDYALFDLTDREWNFIKGQSKDAKRLKRAILLKKPGESVVLDVDLAVLGNLLSLYATDTGTRLRAEKLRQTQGEDRWVDSFLQA
jgi:Type IV secretory pathway, VirB4 components